MGSRKAPPSRLASAARLFATLRDDLKFVGHSGTAIASCYQSLQDLDILMSSYGSEVLQNTGVVETAIGRSLNASENNNQIAAMAFAIASAIKTVLARFGRVSNAEFMVDVNMDYEINASSEDLQALAGNMNT
nr:DUF4055 domain-containing protein [Pseudomonas cichorii]